MTNADAYQGSRFPLSHLHHRSLSDLIYQRRCEWATRRAACAFPNTRRERRETRSFGLRIRSKLSLNDQDAMGSRPCGASVGG
jgi:hypothetical protein